MAFVVLYDACVLYPAPLRDLLLRLAAKGLVRARWTNVILDECFRNILINRPELQAASLDRTRELMNEAIPDVLVTGFEGLITGLELPDPDDRHVLAAAIRAGAQVIVTANLDDFPTERLIPYAIEAQHPDEFVMHQLDLAAGLVCTAVAEQANALKNPPRTVGDVLDALRENVSASHRRCPPPDSPRCGRSGPRPSRRTRRRSTPRRYRRGPTSSSPK